MKNKIIVILAILILLTSNAIITRAQVENFTCFQKNYGEGKGWEKANFKVRIDMDNYKISIHDPKLETYIRFSSNAYDAGDGVTTILIGKDQSGLECKVFVALTKPPTLTVQYFSKFHQIYKLK